METKFWRKLNDQQAEKAVGGKLSFTLTETVYQFDDNGNGSSLDEYIQNSFQYAFQFSVVRNERQVLANPEQYFSETYSDGGALITYSYESLEPRGRRASPIITFLPTST